MTSTESLTTPTTHEARVALTTAPGQVVIDGVWWPRSDVLEDEIPDLDRVVDEVLGATVARFSYVLGSWTDQPRKVRASDHLVKLGWFSTGSHPHVVDLSLSDYRRVLLTVIAPGTPEEEAERLLAAARAGQAPVPEVAAVESPEAVVRRLVLAVSALADPADRERVGLELEAVLVAAAGEARSIAREAEGPVGRETAEGILAAEEAAQSRAPWA